MSIRVIKELCTGCEACIASCPYPGAIVMLDEGVAFITDKCVECGACVDPCPTEAIELIKSERDIGINPDDYKGVWVFVEHRNDKVASVTLELLSEGRKLADELGQELAGVLMGHDSKQLADVCFAYGADKVYYADDPLLANYATGPFTSAFSKLIKAHKPNIVLFGATHDGRDFASRVAVRIYTGLTADCTELSIDPETKLLNQTRPAFGGNIMATILTPNHRPQMATVRPNVMKKVVPDFDKKEKSLSLILISTKMTFFIM